MSLFLTFYGDDFTGSTDCLEALSLAGVRARLYLAPPASVPDGLEAVGIAGASRAMTPDQMRAALPPAFEALKALGAPINHYKVCSTFDSSPTLGSIGCAIEIGQRVFGASVVPVIVGAPMLGRFVAFSNLFARVRADEPFDIHRLDRHPTMSRHPATPMRESDLRLVLAEQGIEGARGIAAPQLDAGRLPPRTGVVVFDTLTEAHLKTIGEYLLAGEGSFVVGSSGVEYALTLARGLAPREIAPAPPVEKILVASGSASPVTERQIARAEREGWKAAPLESPTPDWDILYTARGPDSVRPGKGGEALGNALGEVLAERLRKDPSITRCIVCGGDTSSFVARALGIEAVEFIARAAPGSPLCRIVGGEFAGREVVFKGGQVGPEDFFESVRQGR